MRSCREHRRAAGGCPSHHCPPQLDARGDYASFYSCSAAESGEWAGDRRDISKDGLRGDRVGEMYPPACWGHSLRPFPHSAYLTQLHVMMAKAAL